MYCINNYQAFHLVKKIFYDYIAGGALVPTQITTYIRNKVPDKGENQHICFGWILLYAYVRVLGPLYDLLQP